MYNSNLVYFYLYMYTYYVSDKVTYFYDSKN